MYKTMKIYYDKVTGEKITDMSYGISMVVDFDHDYYSLKLLNERVKSSIGLKVLENGLYEQDFAECTGYRVNPVTKELEFSYPDPNAPGEPPVYQKPLSEQIIELKEKQVATNRIVEGQGTSQQDLLELLIDMGVI